MSLPGTDGPFQLSRCLINKETQLHTFRFIDFYYEWIILVNWYIFQILQYVETTLEYDLYDCASGAHKR